MSVESEVFKIIKIYAEIVFLLQIKNLVNNNQYILMFSIDAINYLEINIMLIGKHYEIIANLLSLFNIYITINHVFY